MKDPLGVTTDLREPVESVPARRGIETGQELLVTELANSSIGGFRALPDFPSDLPRRQGLQQYREDFASSVEPGSGRGVYAGHGEECAMFLLRLELIWGTPLILDELRGNMSSFSKDNKLDKYWVQKRNLDNPEQVGANQLITYNLESLDLEMSEVYQVINERIISLLEQGIVPWHKPWRGAEGAPKNLVSDKAYRGINTFMLATTGYGSPYWVTFKQAK